MNQLTQLFCFGRLLSASLTVNSEDQHCMNKATKEISVEIGGENPQSVMTYIRDEPGYQMNLQCKWILKPATYENPRQMYIQVPVVDFDTNNMTEAQCNNVSNPQLDVLNLKLKLNGTATRDENWCSNKSVKSNTKHIVNMWDPSYNLTLEFRSDDQQIRPDAKGVQVDVQVLGRDYCHRNMLFFEGSCYLITPEKLTPAEAFNISRNYFGNVFTVPENKNRTTKDFLRAFFQRNSDRQGEFPFESPLTLPGQWMWTGYFIDLTGPAPKNSDYALFLNSTKDCCDEKRPLNVSISSSVVNPVSTSESRCAVAVMWNNDGSAKFSCERMSKQLPALIAFKQIPSTKGDTHPQLFRACDTLPLPATTQPRAFTQSGANPDQPSIVSTSSLTFIGLLVVLCIGSVVLICLKVAGTVCKTLDSLALVNQGGEQIAVRRDVNNAVYCARSVFIA